MSESPPRSESPCPGADVLESFVRGRCDRADVAWHVDSCRECAELVAQIRANLAFLTDIDGKIRPDAGALPRAWDIPADLVPGYTIVRELQRGSQGIVYLAMQEQTKRLVAVKMLLHGALASDRQRRRFEHEMEVAASLRHPGIVTVYDSTPARGGRLAYAMEYIEAGVTLDEWCTRQPRTRDGLVNKLRLMAKVCDAVQHAHQRGVIHRDLKPANILVDAAGQPRILDFGIAKTLGTAVEARTTNTGEIVGTPAYASPEQVSGNPDAVDTRSDVYSLGVVLYELITGTLPYDTAGAMVDAVRHIRETPARPLVLSRSSMDRDLDTVARRALEKEASRRYQSAGALKEDILRLLAGDPIEAKRDRAWYVLSRAARRHRIALLVSIVVVGSLGIGTAAAVVGSIRARSASRNEEHAKERAASERTRAASEGARAEAVAGVLNELLPPWDKAFAADPAYAPRAVIDRIKARLDAGLHAARPEVETASRLLLGDIYRDRGLPDDAELQYATAVALARTALSPDHPDVRTAGVRLAGALAARGETDEAKRLVLQLLDQASEDDPARPLFMLTLAEVYLREHDSTAADRCARAVVDMAPATSVNEASIRSSAIDVLARIARDKGDFESALNLSKQAIATRLLLLGDGHPSLVPNLTFLADTLDAWREPKEGYFYRDACVGVTGSPDLESWRHGIMALEGVRSHIFQGDRKEVAQTRMVIAKIHSDLNDHNSSRRCLEETVGFMCTEKSPPRLALTSCLGQLAEQYEWCGRLGEAAGASRKQIGLYAELFDGGGQMLVARAQARLASELARLGRFDQAAALYRRLLSDQHAALTSGDRATAILRLASLHLAEGRLDEARQLLNPVQSSSLVASTPGQWDGEESLVRQAIAVLDESGGLPDSRLDADFERWRPLVSSWRNYRSVVVRMRERLVLRSDEAGAAQLTSLLEESDRVIDSIFRVVNKYDFVIEADPEPAE